MKIMRFGYTNANAHSALPRVSWYRLTTKARAWELRVIWNRSVRFFRVIL